MGAAESSMPKASSMPDESDLSIEDIQSLINIQISYSQFPDVPNPAIGFVHAVNKDAFFVEFTDGFYNIPLKTKFKKVHDVKQLTIAPRNLSGVTIFKNINDVLRNPESAAAAAAVPAPVPKSMFAVGDKVRYNVIDADPSVVFGKIVSIEQHKSNPSDFVYKVQHSANPRPRVVFSDDTSLEKVGQQTPITEVKLKHRQFQPGMFIQYSIANGEPIPAIGRIDKVVHNPQNFTLLDLIIEHTDGTKTIPANHTPIPIILKGKTALTVKPVKFMTLSNGAKVKIRDKVLCRYNGNFTEAIITDFNFKPNSFTVIFKIDGKDVSIPLIDVIRKKEGSKKYTLEDENKYRLKYAKYKAKYLLLK